MNMYSIKRFSEKSKMSTSEKVGIGLGTAGLAAAGTGYAYANNHVNNVLKAAEAAGADVTKRGLSINAKGIDSINKLQDVVKSMPMKGKNLAKAGVYGGLGAAGLGALTYGVGRMTRKPKESAYSDDENHSNAGLGAGLIGAAGLAGTGGVLYHQNKSGIKKIEDIATNELKEGRNKLAKNLVIDRSNIGDTFRKSNKRAKSKFNEHISDLVDDKSKALKVSKKNYESTLKLIDEGGVKLGPEYSYDRKMTLNTGTGNMKGGLYHNHTISQGFNGNLTDKDKQFYKDWAKDLKNETTTEINRQARSEGKRIRSEYKDSLKSNKNKFIEDTSNKLESIKLKKDKLANEVNHNKAKSMTKLSKSLRKNAAIGLTATGLAAGGYYLAKKNTDKKQ